MNVTMAVDRRLAVLVAGCGSDSSSTSSRAARTAQSTATPPRRLRRPLGTVKKAGGDPIVLGLLNLEAGPVTFPEYRQAASSRSTTSTTTRAGSTGSRSRSRLHRRGSRRRPRAAPARSSTSIRPRSSAAPTSARPARSRSTPAPTSRISAASRLRRCSQERAELHPVLFDHRRRQRRRDVRGQGPRVKKASRSYVDDTQGTYTGKIIDGDQERRLLRQDGAGVTDPGRHVVGSGLGDLEQP